MELGTFLQKLCGMIRDLFFSAFGDNVLSGCGDYTVPDDTDWHLFASVSNPCILTVRNLDPANEVYITWNDKSVYGKRIPADSEYIFDRVTGNVFAKVVTPGATVDINFMVVSQRLNE